MVRCAVVAALCLAHAALAVKLKVVMHSEQEDSKPEEEDGWARRKRPEVTLLPFVRRSRAPTEEPDEPTARPRPLHPNDLLFPLIYKQRHINSMFKFGVNWYTWATERRTDGSKAINYYICYDEPKRCDDVGWERTDAIPKCAFQIDSVLSDDRACINPFGVETHGSAAQPSQLCDGAEQMKVSDIVRACGPRVRSLWRFVRAGRRPPAAAKPADVNSLVCEDEEECFVSVEYRIHHDRISFSLHEPSRGQTYKSVLKRDGPPETTEHARKRTRKPRDERGERNEHNKFRLRVKSKPEGKSAVNERNQSASGRRANKLKPRDDLSEDLSE